jgi:hypothetical protein
VLGFGSAVADVGARHDARYKTYGSASFARDNTQTSKRHPKHVGLQASPQKTQTIVKAMPHFWGDSGFTVGWGRAFGLEVNVLGFGSAVAGVMAQGFGFRDSGFGFRA